MDITLFQDTFPGQLVQITAGELKDWAFIPDPLPPKWKFPQDLWPLLVEARESMGMLHGIARTLDSPSLLLRPLQRREALRSSSLEGTVATPEELMLFELEPRAPTSDRDPANVWREVFNYDRALQAGVEMLNKIPLSLRLIRALHRILLTGVRGQDKNPGDFRHCQVQIGSDRRYIPPPVTSLDECLNAFEKYMHARHTFDPLVECYLMHYQFEAIHPFIDGNGRVGRLLLSLITAQYNKFTSSPWLFMSAYFDSYKTEYVDRLFRISTDSDWRGWIEFCLRGTIEQANDTIDRCDQLRQLREEYHSVVQKSVKSGSVRLLAMVDDLFKQPIITIPAIAKKYRITYPTAKSDTDRLIRAGILQELRDDNLSVKTFIAKRVFNIAYHPLRNS